MQFRGCGLSITLDEFLCHYWGSDLVTLNWYGKMCFRALGSFSSRKLKLRQEDSLVCEPFQPCSSHYVREVIGGTLIFKAESSGYLV